MSDLSNLNAIADFHFHMSGVCFRMATNAKTELWRNSCMRRYEAHRKAGAFLRMMATTGDGFGTQTSELTSNNGVRSADILSPPY